VPELPSSSLCEIGLRAPRSRAAEHGAPLHKAFRIHTYENCACNSFRIHTCKKAGESGGSLSHLPLATWLIPRAAQDRKARIFWKRRVGGREFAQIKCRGARGFTRSAALRTNPARVNAVCAKPGTRALSLWIAFLCHAGRILHPRAAIRTGAASRTRGADCR